MSSHSSVEVAVLPAHQLNAHGSEADLIKGDDKKPHSPDAKCSVQLPQLCDPEASALAETRPPLLKRCKGALSRSLICRLFGMRVALDHNTKAAALAKEEAILTNLAEWSARTIDQCFAELG